MGSRTTFKCQYCDSSSDKYINICSNKEHHRKAYAKQYYENRAKHLNPKGQIPITFTFEKVKIHFD